MSAKPIGPDSDLERLADAGYRVEVRHQHILLHDVPYVLNSGSIGRGTLACQYVENAGFTLPPENHVVMWTGDFPCFAGGAPIEQIRHVESREEPFPGFVITHRFSNKPEGISNFGDHYSKLVHYATLLQSQAKAVDATVDARGEKKRAVQDIDHKPFAYADSASARAEIQSLSRRLALKRVAIVGLGGTGSYILDQVAKTPVAEIHLFDGDLFLQHNAFRAPGAATREELEQQASKTDYFKHRYEAMHLGIASHPYYLTFENLSELADFDFVFICVDAGAIRRMLFDHLLLAKIPFIDVGMDLHLVQSTNKLVGSCRYTLCTPQQNSHFPEHAPMETDDADAIYRQNIQIADMNALNAQLAVMKWKQYFGFYQDDFGSHNVIFSVNSTSLVRDVLAPTIKQ